MKTASTHHSEEPRRPVQRLHELVDTLVGKTFKASDYPCKRGCQWCCYLVADCCLDEATEVELAIRDLDRATRKQIHDQEKRWYRLHGETDKRRLLIATAFRDGTLMSFVSEHARLCEAHFHLGLRNKVACPYLIGGECSVYHSRPVTCRDSYPHNVTDPENCKDPSTGISGIIHKDLVAMGESCGVDITNQSRLPDQVKAARLRLK